DEETVEDLLRLIEERPRGLVPLLLVAEAELARARRDSARGHLDATAVFRRAVGLLREAKSPYHLAEGLLDFAEHLASGRGGADGQDGAVMRDLVEEASELAGRIGAAPLSSRACRLSSPEVPAVTT
ncbi:MAG: hypothetical protein ACRDZP_07790, partial [Acidimicrobiales bacterium]